MERGETESGKTGGEGKYERKDGKGREIKRCMRWNGTGRMARKTGLQYLLIGTQIPPLAI